MSSLNLHEQEVTEVEGWIHDVLAKNTGKNPAQAELLKEPLKEYLNQLVDKVQFPQSEPTPSEPEPLIPEDFSLVEQVKRKLATAALDLDKKKQLKESLHANRAHSIHEPTQVETSYTHMRSFDSFDMSRQEKAHFSEFGTSIHSYQFSKSKRSLDLASHRSPGPAFYNPNTSALKQKLSTSTRKSN